jgi:hypothetical protein
VPELPPPLPPAERTIGQLIGESIKSYGAHFWRALVLGLPLLVIDQLIAQTGLQRHVDQAIGLRGVGGGLQDVVYQALLYLLGAPLMVAGYVWACVLVLGVRPTRLAFGIGLLVYLPFPFLRSLLILPAIAWFALIGLAVPATLVERTALRASLARGLQLGRADYRHAFGSLCALVIVVGVAENTLTTLLRSGGQASTHVALGLTDLILSPMLFLGGAMLYVDQAARVRRSEVAAGRTAAATALPEFPSGS